jgi:hypothetical protein
MKKNKRRITREQALDALLGFDRRDVKLLNYCVTYIIQAENGALLISADGVALYEFVEEDMKGLRRLHYAIDEALGYYGGKHDPQRMRHAVDHRPGYNCGDFGCPICHGEDPQV